MAKKFSKFLLFTAAVGAAGATAYYFMQKKNLTLSNDESDEDYDDFSDKSGDTDTASRTYVPLDHDTSAETKEEETPETEDNFTPLSEKIAPAEATVEEFFDETDSDEAKK